jgi:hypothetical protein
MNKFRIYKGKLIVLIHPKNLKQHTIYCHCLNGLTSKICPLLNLPADLGKLGLNSTGAFEQFLE